MRFGYVVPLEQFKQDVRIAQCPRNDVSELVRNIENYPTRNRRCVLPLFREIGISHSFGFYETQQLYSRRSERITGRALYLYIGKFHPILMWGFCTERVGHAAWDNSAEIETLLEAGLSVFRMITEERHPIKV